VIQIIFTESFLASIETVSLNLARHKSESCSLADASGVRVKLSVTMEKEGMNDVSICDKSDKIDV
jgi:hypothetical protein